MATNTLGLFCLLQQIYFLYGSLLQVQEAGVRYNQSVVYDPLTADVISHVPRHTRDGILFRESTKIENLFLGLSVWREENDGHCFFRRMMEYESPLELSALVTLMEKEKTVVDAKKMIQVLVWATPEGLMSEEDRDGLTTDMKAPCQGVPIVVMHSDKLNQEQFSQKMEEAGDCYRSQSDLKNGRKRRSAGRRLQSQIVCSTCKIHGSVRQAKRKKKKRREEKRSIGDND